MTNFLNAAHSSGTRPEMVGVIVSGGTETFSKKGSDFGTGADGVSCLVLGEGDCSVTYDKGIVVGGGSPNSVAVVGSAGPLEGGHVGGLEGCRDECPKPARACEVE